MYPPSSVNFFPIISRTNKKARDNTPKLLWQRNSFLMMVAEEAAAHTLPNLCRPIIFYNIKTLTSIKKNDEQLY
jgi:hypothetical protein